MLTEAQCKLIETGLTEDVEPRKVAAYLCLHIGLTPAEVTALRVSDIELEPRSVTLRNVVNATGALTPLETERVLPMPPHVARYIRAHRSLYKSEACFILTGETDVPPFYHMQNILTAIAVRCRLGGTLSASDLRNAFIRRCIQSGMDLYSICVYVGIKQPNVIVKRFAEYFEPQLECVNALEGVIPGVAPHKARPAFSGPKRMNLLILGAGGQGHVVKETAEDIGIFDKIAFLDDNTAIPGVLGPLDDYWRYADEYPVAFVAIGQNDLRNTLIDRLEAAGFIVPVLRHPSATISPTVQTGAGTIFEAKVIVNASAKIGKGVILASASVIDHGAVIGDYVHVDVGAMVKKDSVIPEHTKVRSGGIFDSGRDGVPGERGAYAPLAVQGRAGNASVFANKTDEGWGIVW